MNSDMESAVDALRAVLRALLLPSLYYVRSERLLSGRDTPLGTPLAQSAALRSAMRNTFAALAALAALVFPFARETAVLAQDASLPIGWTAADVGDVGKPGRSSRSGSTWSVEGAGADIWGTVDAFHFAYTPTDGDAEIYSLVRSEQPTHQFAKAGLMIRHSLNPASDNVLIDVKPDGGIEVLTRRLGLTGGPTTRFVAGATTSGPVWLKLSRKGENVSAFISTSSTCSALNPSCTSWTPVAVDLPFWPGRALLGIAVTSHDTSAVNSAVLDFLQVTQLTRPWSQRNSFPSDRGLDNAWTSDGVFHVPGAGSDIWGTSDEFQFVSQTGRGDAEIVARTVRLDDTNRFAKAGVMMRANPGPTAAHVILDVKPDGGIEFMTRPADSAATHFIAGGFMPFPAWLRLVRRGNQVDGYASNDGSGWALIGTTTLSLAKPDYSVGLAVTSHDPNVVNNAEFDNVSLSGLNREFYGPNLLQKSGFEEYAGPELGPPWVSDRAAPWTVETAHPHGGAKNAACRPTSSQDCGIYQEIQLPQTGRERNPYILTFHASADKPGAIFGIDINGTGSPGGPVDVRQPGTYSEGSRGLILPSGGTLRVWMYSPAGGPMALLDDVTLSEYSGPR
jgi:hypothetical protein